MTCQCVLWIIGAFAFGLFVGTNLGVLLICVLKANHT